MTKITRALLLLTALALVAAACGDSGGDTTTTTTPLQSETTTTTAPPPTTTTTAPEEAEPTTTTAAPTTTTTAAPTTTVPPTTTTAAAVSTEDIVNDKIEAALAVVPEGWTSTEDPEDAEAEVDDFLFDICGPPDGYDLDNLGSDTAEIREIDIQAPAEGSIFGGPMADVEARQFVSQDVAEFAFAFLQFAFGTDEGRQCLADELLDEFAGQIPVDEDQEPLLTVEEIEVDGADIAARISITISTQGLTVNFFVDYAAALVEDCTVVSTFLAIGDDPFPEDIANAIMAAATFS